MLWCYDPSIRRQTVAQQSNTWYCHILPFSRLDESLRTQTPQERFPEPSARERCLSLSLFLCCSCPFTSCPQSNYMQSTRNAKKMLRLCVPPQYENESQHFLLVKRNVKTQNLTHITSLHRALRAAAGQIASKRSTTIYQKWIPSHTAIQRLQDRQYVTHRQC